MKGESGGIGAVKEVDKTTFTSIHGDEEKSLYMHALRICQEEQRIRDESVGKANDTTKALVVREGKSKFKCKCFKCGKLGHKAKKCKDKKIVEICDEDDYEENSGYEDISNLDHNVEKCKDQEIFESSDEDNSNLDSNAEKDKPSKKRIKSQLP